MTRLFIVLFFLTSVVMADVKSTTGQIKFDTQMDNQAEMTLNGTGLGIGVTPSTNLHVNGNTIISNQLFVGGSNGSSNLNVNGTLSYGFQTVSSNTTLDDSSIVLVDSSSDNITITLPYAGNVSGRQYQIKKVSTSNSVWILGGGKLIDDTSPIELPESSSLASVKLISDGIQWYKIEQKDIFETVASDNLVGWWKLDEASGSTAIDSSQNNHEGIITNFSSANLGKTGVIKTAYEFDGTNDRVQIPNDETLRGMSQLTLSVWIYAHSKSNYDRILVKSDNNAVNSDRTYRLMMNNTGKLRFMCFNQSQTLADILEDGTFSLNTWIHMVGVYDGTNTYLYLNGNVQSDVGNLTGTVYSDSGIENTVTIGGGEQNNNFSFNGIIDDARIYNRALTASEIQALYNQGQ